MPELQRPPYPSEIDAQGYVVLAALPKETPLARRQRERQACCHGHPWLPETTIICTTADYPPRRVRRCLVCLGRYRLPVEVTG